MAKLPYDGAVEAQYADGYIHSETELADVSAFHEGKNVFYDILEKRPEADHGRLVRFSVFYQDHRYDVDWRTLPGNARPIRFKKMERDFDPSQGWLGDPHVVGIDFGYQYTDEQGRNVQEVMELS